MGGVQANRLQCSRAAGRRSWGGGGYENDFVSCAGRTCDGLSHVEDSLDSGSLKHMGTCISALSAALLFV